LYSQLIDELQSSVPLEAIDSFSLGVFRMNQQFLKRIQARRKDAGLLFHPFEASEETISYKPLLKQEMLLSIKNKIVQKHSKAIVEML
jgi:hypothetical protein